MHAIYFVVYTALWLVFCGATVWWPAALDRTAAWFMRLPLIGKIIVVIILLPYALGLWVWRRVKWPLMERRLIILLMAALWCYGLFPRAR